MDTMYGVNPATGLPTIDGVDAGGNAFGCGNSMWDYDSSRYHSCRLPEREYGFLKFISVSSIIIALIAIFS